MAGTEDSNAVSSTSDEVVNYISTPIQDGFDDQVTMDIALCNLEPIEESNTVPVLSNPAQEDAPNDSIFVPGNVINGHQDSLTIAEQNPFSSSDEDLSESSECGDERGDAYSMSSVMEENKILKKKNRVLEEQVEKLMKENEAQKQQLEKASAQPGFVQSKEEQFSSAACAQQLWRGVRQGEMDNNINPSSFKECKEDARGGIDSTGGDCVVPQEASCDCKQHCYQQLTESSNQISAQMLNKHQVFVKAITSSGTTCNSIVQYRKTRGCLDGAGVLIAILGPPCKKNGVPDESIILMHTMSKAQDGACESMLLEMAYERAPAAKYCVLQTTFDNCSMCVNPGVTAEALSFLIKQWPQWKEIHSLHTLIVIIPYGGKYKMDEEIAVNEASAYGIIIVAASGWGGMGIAFPAKLSSVISVASARCDGTLSPKGRELDCIGLGFLKIGSDFMIGTGISTIRIATDLALLFQHLSCTNRALIRSTCIDTYVLKALFEYIAGDIIVTGDDVMAIIDLPKLQLRRYIEQILWRRDRRAVLSDSMLEDAQSNTKHWSSENVNKQYRKEDKDFPYLSGKNIIIAIIDESKEDFLLHLKDHGVEVHTATKGVKYFRFHGTMLYNGCCIKHIKVVGGHGLQCAAIVANTAPNCTILMIIRNDLDLSEKEALSIVMKQKADILMLSSVTTDTVDSDYLYNISAHLSCRIVLCAAGNEGKCDRMNTICYPSRARGVIVIGACDRHGERCRYSSCGKQVDFLCPGQFSIADSSGKGGTCYSTSAAAALIALVLEYIDQKLSTAPQIKVWVSTEEEWKPHSLPYLARNTHLMRALLSSKKLLLCHCTEHSSTVGYGALLIDNLNMLTPDGISQLISDFHFEPQLAIVT